jgi:hypothetical protein
VTFEWVAGTIGVALTLGMTRQLLAWVALYRSRHHATLDWVPFCWSACIFYSLLEFSWALRGLASVVGGWTLPIFLALFGLALLLFTASALILPPGELQAGQSLQVEFERDGKAGVAVLGVYEALTLVANATLWDTSPISVIGAVNTTLAILCVLFLRSRTRRAQATVTVLFTVLEFSTLGLV